MENDPAAIYKNPALLLQKLIRFNTSNPPGDEAECIGYIRSILQAAGMETILVGAEPGRPNLIAKLKGRGNSAPILMYGHADVVPAEDRLWKYPPFDGVLMEGCVWGRGALDMKGALAMMICAMLRAQAENVIPQGDVLLAVLTDEEAEGKLGARYLVEQHKELFKDVRYAIGELGGFTMHLAGKRFYPIMVAEKQKCCLKITVSCPGGHGSMPMRNGAMARLGRILNILDKQRLPVHISPSVEKMLKTFARNLPFPQNTVFYSLLNPMLTDRVLGILGEQAQVFDSLLHNTVNATIVRGGNKINVIPSEAVLELDGRILPGFSSDDIVNELRRLLGRDMEIEVTFFERGPKESDMEFFSVLEKVLYISDKEAIPVPAVISGVTDARFFNQLGIQTYGFTPMCLPAGFEFSKLIHAANERIPVEALEFGSNALFDLINYL